MPTRDAVAAYVSAKLAEGPALARELTHDGGSPLPKRDLYRTVVGHVDLFLAGRKGERVVVLPGPRGVGKTTLLLQVYEHLTVERGLGRERVLYVSADEMGEYLGARVSDVVLALVEDLHRTTLVGLDAPLFVLLDEAHYDKGWDVAVKVAHDRSRRMFFLVTGSSALSMEMGVDLARRARKEAAYPLSFSEDLALAHGLEGGRAAGEAARALLLEPSEEAVGRAADAWAAVRREAAGAGVALEGELGRFMSCGGFPFGLGMEEGRVHDKVFGMVGRVVERDVLARRTFNTGTRGLISRIVYYLALQRPGGTSDAKLARSLAASSRLVRAILDVLEMTRLVFSVRPYGGAGRAVRKPWRYYFAAPSVSAALRAKLGSPAMSQRDAEGVLAETLAAATLFRMKEEGGNPAALWYDPREGGADFLIQTGAGRLVPVEVGVGEKDERQVRSAMRAYKAPHGVVVSGGGEPSMSGRVVRMPLGLFAMG